mmetsp:Transcript_25768/g.79272  ORF Transcript_25768/g.79272 Transcript_25768/m.79272 type:complete len:397 (+) Transcript_25768:63-1253(+)
MAFFRRGLAQLPKVRLVATTTGGLVCCYLSATTKSDSTTRSLNDGEHSAEKQEWRLFSKQQKHDSHQQVTHCSAPMTRRIERSARGRLLLSDAEVTTVAHLINDVVDLPFFNEEEEQDIFEFSVAHFVEQLAHALPLSVMYHVHSSSSFDVSKAEAKEFEERLTKWLYRKCDLPFLAESDQRKIVRCLLVLLLRSMRKPRSQVGALNNVEMHKLVFEVFVKGALEVFFDDACREDVRQKVASYASAVPFLPSFVVCHVCDVVLDRASDGVTPILVDTYYQFLRACDDSSDADKYRPSFTATLRRNLCDYFIDQHVVWMLSLVPRPHAERYALLFVDSFLEAIDASKLDVIMACVGKDPRIRRALIVEHADDGDGSCDHHALQEGPCSDFFRADRED